MECKYLLATNENEYGSIEIKVIDTGVGIKKADQDKLFKLFGFLQQTKELNTKGIGLGLHISKMIVNKFDGDLTCDSIYGKGSTFQFIFVLDKLKEIDTCLVNRFKNPNGIKTPTITINNAFLTS
jgi:signal transduction histidine kinase